MTSTHTTSTPEELIAARVNDNQPLWFQLYKKTDDKIAGELVKRATELGFSAICLTADTAGHGNRERDTRAQAAQDDDELEEDLNAIPKDFPPDDELIEEEEKKDQNDDGSTSGALKIGDDADMTWEVTIPWLRSVTNLPIIVKGIQCTEDAVEAVNAGVDAIVVSNHGGRQLEYSLPSIDVLYQIRVQRPDVFGKIEVYVDGGVRRGTDVLKALCMGAKAVGLGRPFLYANGAYGEPGVMKVIRILEKEIVTGMRLLGAQRIEDLVPDMIERIDFQSKL